ncbi:serine-rich adhesin for platelets isoform X6 [Wyeomyia smithii]|uniref:serine-rich adhesin for platelets isoform X6 n=1 Tax=Wyeomyia smithii TaxID=174621 RepID=UPI00246807D7|nr:serine-rich adhesin for platelets isoform X6 [Wyeomyia smithii]
MHARVTAADKGIKTTSEKPPTRSYSNCSHGPPWRKIAAAMSTLTSNANSNNNNLIINTYSTSATSQSGTGSVSTNNNNNNNSNSINNNSQLATQSFGTTTTHQHHYQSALASSVSSVKRLLPLPRSMSSSSNGGGGGAGASGVGPSGSGMGTSATVGSSGMSVSGGMIPTELNVVLHGYHRKLKTNKKKYFVVYGDTPEKSARLEYFDSEKKFKQSWLKSSSVQAKRSIVLRSCFNINKRHDTKKHVIALYTKDDCFCIVFDSEDELNRWLRTLLSLQRGEESEGEPPRPTFEHVWDVFVQRKGLGDSYGILGNYRLCITDKTLSLVRIGPPTTATGDSRVEVVEFSLASIRRCGASQRYFYLEVGRSSKTGAGEIWMEAQDTIIAQNMHTTIMKSAKSKDDTLGPMRDRSSSENAVTKPTPFINRHATHAGPRPINFSPSGEDQSSSHASNAQGSESSSSATSTNTVVMVPQNPNSSQNLKANQNHQPNSDKLCTSTTSIPASTSHQAAALGSGQTIGGPPGFPIPGSPLFFYSSPTLSSGKTSIKKPKLDPPQEEEGSASSLSMYSSIQPPQTGGNSQAAQLTQHHTGAPVGLGATGTPSFASTASVCSGNTATTTDFPSPSDDHATESSCASTAMLLPPSPSMGKFRDYHNQPPMMLVSSTTSLSSVTNGGSSGGSDSSSCCSSTASIQTAITSSTTTGAPPQLYAMLPPPVPPQLTTIGTNASGSSLSLAAISRHTRTALSNNSVTNPLFLSTIPLWRLRNSLRRHSVSGAALGRDRCDSLPSRNRTTSETSTHQQQLIMNSGGMPPPRTIPSASFNRPHSMVVSRQSHSHSPPVHSSPLSPPSTGACSTGSDGSSLSIDETDSFVGSLTPDEGNGFSKVINALSSGCSIPEENSDEYIHNYGRINQGLFSQHRSIDEFGSHTIRRNSPAPPANAAGSVEGGSSNYMEMCSPCGSSPGDPSGNGGYIPMSPIADFPRSMYLGSSSAHSRASSLAEDTVDGYVPMAAPSHTTEEYVDMEPSHNSNSSSNRTVPVPTVTATGMIAGNGGNISSAASSCSITSGTPSTDMRFSEYHLEKVVARFTPSEDDEMDRPLRTYSVGSRLEHNKRKLRVDMLSSEASSSNSRARAFSVGSRAKVPRSDLYKGAPITAPLLSTGSSGSMQESSSNTGSISNSAIGVDVVCSGVSPVVKTGKKSSSAPVLAIKQHGSFDPMDDLMEIDFGTPFHGEQDVNSSTPQKAMGMEDYMEMTAGSGNQSIAGYVEMKPGHILSTSANTSAAEENDYLDMRPGTAGLESNLSTKSTSSPIKINSPKKFNGGGGSSNSNYLDMSSRSMEAASKSSTSSLNRTTKAPSEDYLNISPLMMSDAAAGSGGGGGGDSGNEDKMTHEDDELVAPSSAPEGYMEMSWNQNKSGIKSDSHTTSTASDEYINMDFTRREMGGSLLGPESRLSSHPITIQPGNGNRASSGDLMEPKMGGVPSSIPNYLPLNPATAAIAQRHPVAAQIGFSPKPNSSRSRCDSRDSGIVTPSGSQATIFPFSPGSPIKSFTMSSEPSAEERKCYMDGTTGTLRISEMEEDGSEFLVGSKPQPQSKDPESSKLEDLSHNYAELSLGQQQQQQQQKTDKSRQSSFSSTKRTNLSLILTTSTNTRTTATVTTMKTSVEYPDYVNCSPATTPVAVSKPATPMAVDDQAGDYAIMNPASLRKLSSTSQSELLFTTDASLPPLTRKSNLIGFKPITSSQDEVLLQKKGSGFSPKPIFNRQYSERRPGSSSMEVPSYEMLQRSYSRPNSVNSEKISSKCPSVSAGSTRPNSANSDRLPTISATSSSASSTSTLCESKNQSPTASSTMIAASGTISAVTHGARPDSVTSHTDPHIISRPPSVSSERELHYASLDLPPCGTNPPPSASATSRMEVDSDGSAPPSANSAGRPGGGSDSMNSSPSPNSGCTSQQQTGSAFTYAQIDFVRSLAQAQQVHQQQQQQPSSKSSQQ